MKAHVVLLAAALLIAGGCGEAAPANPDRPTAEKPVVTPPPQFDQDRPDESAIELVEYIPYEQPVYAARKLPVFDGLVRMENGIAAVEPYLTPAHPRLRIDWPYLRESSASIELGLKAAIDEHWDTGLNQKERGGGTPVFGDGFQLDLVKLHGLTKRLNWAVMAQDLKSARFAFEALQVQLGQRRPLPKPTAKAGSAGQPAAGDVRMTPTRIVDNPPERDTAGDDLIQGKTDDYGNLAAVKLATNLRTRYDFWPAPAGLKKLYLAANPPPKQIEYTYDMTHSYEFDLPKYPQPAIVNDRDLRDENEYSRRVSTTETR